MRKDDHLINESISRASLNKLYSKLQSDFENAAGILDSLRRIHKIPEKYWVSILKGYKAWENKSMGENAEWDEMEMEKEDVEFIKNNNIPWKWMYEENAEGQSVGSGSEYHKARKDAFEGTGEEIGKGRIKLELTQDENFTCVRNMEEQDVRFVKGTIFNCNEWEGDFYTCQSKEYGGIVVFPNNVKILSAPPGEVTHMNDEEAESPSTPPGDFTGSLLSGRRQKDKLAVSNPSKYICNKLKQIYNLLQELEEVYEHHGREIDKNEVISSWDAVIPEVEYLYYVMKGQYNKINDDGEVLRSITGKRMPGEPMAPGK